MELEQRFANLGPNKMKPRELKKNLSKDGGDS